MKLHTKVAEALQLIDKYVFDGETSFEAPQTPAELKRYFERWVRRLTAPGEEYTRVDSYALGAGPHRATRFTRDDGLVELHAFNGSVVGHGNTAREAATHLAEQLRVLAQQVEGHEGERKEKQP